MKKLFIDIALAGFVWSCSGGTNENSEVEEVAQEDIEALEESTETLDEAMEAADAAIDTLQAEVDSLLNNLE